MKTYAQLNENNICTGISQLSGEVIQENMIELPSASMDYMWKKYENNQWSTDKFEPKSTAPIDEFTAMQNSVTTLGQQLAQEKLSNIQKDSIINGLGQQVTDLKLQVIKIQGGTN
jgi:hypothetical protein